MTSKVKTTIKTFSRNLNRANLFPPLTLTISTAFELVAGTILEDPQAGQTTDFPLVLRCGAPM